MSIAQQKTLLSAENVSYQIELENMMSMVVSEPRIGSFGVPKFGMYSLLARTIPVFAYDHPDLIRKVPTAFTEGKNIFISVPFMNEIMESELAFSGDPDKPIAKTPSTGKNGLVFLTLHEIAHNMFRHLSRMTEMDFRTRLIAQDLSINTRLLRDFVFNPDKSKNILHPLPEALAIGYGFEKGDIEKYSGRSEEDIGRELLEEMKEQDSKKNGQSGGGQGGGNGQSSSGSEPSNDAAQQGMGTEHLMTPEDFAKLLKEAGLGHIIEKLNLPVNPDGTLNEQKANDLLQKQMIDLTNAVSKMEDIKRNIGENRTPGGHSNDCAKQLLDKINKPKVSWKNELKALTAGEAGQRLASTFNHPSDAYFIDPANMGMPNRLYLDAKVPAKPNMFNLVLLDTSGSMGESDLRESVSEVFGLVDSANATAPDLLFLQIDTVVRGEPVEITKKNVDSLISRAVEIYGRGGTSLTEGINMALNSPAVVRKIKSGQKLQSLIYFTDLGDTPPKKEDLSTRLPKKVVYMATPGNYNDFFANAVSDYAKTISMGEKMEVDLSQEEVKVKNKKRA